MFKLEENKKIGKYLLELINEKYQNQSKFCEDYIIADGREVNNEETRKMQNRLSQIKNGKKSIQTYDLPIFTKLLDVSSEEILSAGQFFVPKLDRLTNYSVAFSTNEEVWEAYINHPEKLILNIDEYGNTALDYAFKFKNGKFLNYLIDKGYIWFDEKGAFSANSDIKSNLNGRWNDPRNCYLNLQLNENAFREKIIGLAVSENNIKLLNRMHAREISQLYYLSTAILIRGDILRQYNEEINGNIVKANADVINYFIEEFEIPQDNDNKLVLMYPFISGLLDCLIRENSNWAEIALKNAITHSQNAYINLISMIEKAIKEEYERISQLKEELINHEKPRSLKFVLSEFNFNENNNVVNFRNHYKREELTTNLATVTETSKDEKINKLIAELNESFNKIVNIKNKFLIE